MIDDDLSGLPRSALRDYEGDARLDRVWHRLDSELTRPRARSGSSWLLAPAFGVVVFAAGVLVGRTWLPTAAELPQAAAERPVPAEPVVNPGAPAGGGRELVEAPLPSSRPRSTGTRVGGPVQLPLALRQAPVSDFVPYVAPHAPAAPPGLPAWQRLAESGDFDAARSAIARAGGFELVVTTASPDELMVLVDIARSAGNREQAVGALRRLVQTFPGTPEAPLAAWTLGNLLEQGGDAPGAAEAYALYRRLSPAGDFAEDAAARQVDVALSQADVELATRLVEQYAKDFPSGRRIGEFREELGKLQSAAADAGIAAQGDTPAPSEPPAAAPPPAP